MKRVLHRFCLAQTDSAKEMGTPRGVCSERLSQEARMGTSSYFVSDFRPRSDAVNGTRALVACFQS